MNNNESTSIASTLSPSPNFIDNNQPNNNNYSLSHSNTTTLSQSPQSNPIDPDIITELNQLRSENKALKSLNQHNEVLTAQNKDYRSTIVAKERESAILKEKLRLIDIAKTKNEDEYINDLRKELIKEYEHLFCPKTDIDSYKASVNEKELMITSLELKLKEANQLNESLSALNANLKEQTTKRSNNDSNEINKILEHVSQLENEKIDNERTISDLTDMVNSINSANGIGLNSNGNANANGFNATGVIEYKKAITQLKNELKQSNKKNTDDRLHYESEIKLKDTTIIQLEERNKILDFQMKNLETDITQLTKINESLKTQLDSLKSSQSTIDSNAINKLKGQYDSMISEHKHSITELNAQLFNQDCELDKLRQLESVYKHQLAERDKETESKVSYINQLQSLLNKQIDDNLKLRQDNASIANELKKYQSKYDQIVIDSSNRRGNLEDKVTELMEVIKRKKKIISNKKKENVIVADLVNCKKSEIQCIEALQIVKSQTIIDNLCQLKEKEKGYMEMIENITKDEDYTDDSVEKEEKDGEDGEDDDECGDDEGIDIDEEDL